MLWGKTSTTLICVNIFISDVLYAILFESKRVVCVREWMNPTKLSKEIDGFLPTAFCSFLGRVLLYKYGSFFLSCPYSLLQAMTKSTERGIDTFVDEKAASIYSNKGGSSGKSSDDYPFQKSEAEKKLVKKLNWTLLPFVGAIVFIQFVDKSTLGISAVLGIIEDTHLTGSQYSWLGSFFYLGYISFQLPNNYLIQKLPISKYLGTLLILWGIVMGLTALCQNFAQLVVCRVFLGLFEAGTYPCLLIVINAVYRRSEQSAAYGFLWLSNGTGTMIGASCAYGISYIDNARGIHSWKWPYIIWGALTVLFGIICFFFLPDTPQSFMFRLAEEEKLIVAERSRDNCVVRVQKIKVHHVWEALGEMRLWLICLACFFNNLLTGGVVVFNTLIVKSMGYSVSCCMRFSLYT